MSGTTWQSAREQSWLMGRKTELEPILLPLEDAVGRIAAEPLTALVSLPTTSVSAMDGWAVAGDAPWLVGERVGMGSVESSSPLAPSAARPITTGAPIPGGTFGVLRSEHGETSEDDTRALWLRRRAGADPSEPVADGHIRVRGEELDEGTIIVSPGSMFTPARIALAAACGHDSALVRAQPRVSVVITGDELVSSGIPSAGLVRDALGPIIPALTRGAGGTAISIRTVADTVTDTTDAIDTAEGELIVTTGGSSHGATDLVRQILLTSGGIVFDGVDVRPGHPVMLGRNRSGTPVLALPGNPLAAVACFVSFGIPLIRGLLGLENEPIRAIDIADLPPDVLAALARGLTVVAPFSRQDGVAVLSPWRGAAMVRGLADADGLLVLEPSSEAPGCRATTLDLPW